MKNTVPFLGMLLPSLAAFAPHSAWAADPPASPAAATATDPPPTSASAAPSPDAASPAVAEPAPNPEAAPAATEASATNPTPSPSSEVTVADSPYGSTTTPPSPNENPPPRKHSDDGPAMLFDPSVSYALGALGGFGVHYTRLAGKGAVAICGEGGVIIDHALSLGGGGCGIPTRVSAANYGPVDDRSPNDRLHFGYGGAIVKYHFFPMQLGNVSVGTLIGAGALEIAEWDGDGDQSDWDSNYTHKRSEVMFIVEPQVGGYINFFRWLRAGATVGYRIASGVDTEELDGGDFSGVMIGGTLQAGWF